MLLERGVSRLSTLDQETRRWLRSAKQSEPDVRPFARLQNADSQARYAGYMKRCLCYIMRVHKGAQSQAQPECSGMTDSDSEASENETSGGDHSDSDGDCSLGSTDVLRDAKRLFPWYGSLKDQVQRLWEVIEQSREQEVQTKAL